jgi:hypothetical protein
MTAFQNACAANGETCALVSHADVRTGVGQTAEADPVRAALALAGEIHGPSC